MEEMAGNVIKHGFGKDGKENHIDIRVVHKGDDMILRIRDNCTAFNPAERANAMEQGETGKNIGIRMVYKIAGDVSYQNLLGLNVLTIRI
jgi:anti-sigma regulatory factor (Ser/Thr protein kinase)